MRVFVFFALYGMLTITGVFLSVFWCKLGYRRFQQLSWPVLRTDRYFWLAAALGLYSVGSVILFGAWAAANFHFGLSPNLSGFEGVLITLGLAIILCAEVIMVWLADLERKRPLWLWGIGGMTILWTLVSLWLAS